MAQLQRKRLMVLWSPCLCVTEDAKTLAWIFSFVKPKHLVNLLNSCFRFPFIFIFFLSSILDHGLFIQEDEYAKRKWKKIETYSVVQIAITSLNYMPVVLNWRLDIYLEDMGMQERVYGFVSSLAKCLWSRLTTD